MSPYLAWQLLSKELPASAGRYALIDCAATAAFSDGDEIFTRLNRPGVEKHSLFTGQNAWAIDQVAPYMVRLNDQPDLHAWLLEHGWGRNWAVFFASEAPVKTLLAHFRKLFEIQAENGRKVFFRLYDPQILRQFISLLAPPEALAVFGPVTRFVAEDDQGRPLVFERPADQEHQDLDPVKVILSKRTFFSYRWNQQLLQQHLETYRGLGLEAVADPAADALTLTDKAGSRVRLEKTGSGVSVTTAEGRLFQYELTTCKHPARVTDPAGNAIDFDIQERQNRPESAAGENLLDAIRMGTSDKAYVFEYDDINHLLRMDCPDGTHLEFDHDSYGDLRGFIDRNSQATRIERDEHRRLNCLTDANGHQTRFEYDDLTAPAAIAFADGNRFAFDYTDAGTLEKFFTGDRLAASYRVDPNNGSWSVNYADGTRAEFIVEQGRIVRAANATGTVELAYDANGWLVKETFAGRTVTYHRNAAGQLVGLTTPFGQRIDYIRDQENRVCAIGDWQGRTVAIDYAACGALSTIVYPNGARLSQRSTREGLPAELRLDGRDRPIFQRTFTRDALNRVTRINDTGLQIVYTYDKQGRLLKVQGDRPDLTENFQLDAKANRLMDDRDAYDIDPADRITQAGPRPFSYDGLGNLTRGGASYTYTALNRLQSVPDADARYRYDALGRRVEKIVNGHVTRFIWAGAQLLHEIQWDEADPLTRTGRGPQGDEHDLTVVIDYLFFPQTPVLLALRRDGHTLWAATGHRHEVLCLTGEDGRPAWQADYDAFGNAHIRRGHRIFQPLRLCGQYHDAETGLHYNLARYYDPGLGRYLSLDPLFLEGGGTNFYAYCDGDPINRIDPNGEFVFCAMLIGAAIGAAIGAGLEAWQQHSHGKDMDGFKIAKAALLGGVIGAVGAGVGTAVEAAVAAGSAGTALASGTMAGMGATGFLSGTAGSVAEQCAEAIASGNAVSPLNIVKQALTDGVLGAGIGMVTLGAGGFAAKRLKKAASALRPKLPAQRASRLMAKAKEKTRNLTARIKSAASSKNGRSRQFCVSDPVDPVTGQVVLDQDDFTLAGRIPLTWSRHYSSQSDFEGLLGAGWQCPADARLQIDPEGFVTFYDGTPKAAVFESLPEDQPLMEAADGALLEKEQEGYQVRLKSGLAFHFAAAFTDGCSPVVQISDPEGHYLRFERQDGRLVQISDDNGQRLQVTCDQGRITQIARHDRALVRYIYHDGLLIGAMDVLGHAKRFEYRGGRLVRHMDKNKVSFHYGYDAAGRCTHVWDDDGLYDYYLEYLPLERRTRATDSRGRVQTFVYDADNLPVQVIDYDGAVTAYAYDDVGRLIQVTDPLGRRTQYDYDNAGNPTQVFGPDNHRIVVVYNADHRPVQVQDPNGKIWEQHFDDKGRLIEKIDPLDGRTAYSYTDNGDLESIRDAEGHLTRFSWDARGLLEAVTDPVGGTVRYQRDLWGSVTAVIDAAGAAVRYVYDDKGRLVQALDPTGPGRSFAWDPEDNLTARTDELGHQTRFEYGGVNQLVKRINADGTFVAYHYDSEENLVGVTNENGRTYRFDYDPAGRLTRRTDYYGASTHYTYDAASQLIESRDPLDRVVNYTWDTAGRLQSKTFDNDERETFSWDAAGNLIGFNSLGGHGQRFFDAAGNLIAEQSNGFTVEYQYDANGRRVQRTSSNGNRVQYGYDPAGALSRVTINDQPAVAIERDRLGRIVREQFSKHLQRTFDYDENGRLTVQRINSDAVRILRAYHYDAAGNLIEKNDSHKGPFRFEHDPLGRITQARDPEQRLQRFDYDPAGDLLEHLPDAGRGLRTARLNGIEHQYDAAGNLVQRRQGVALSSLDWDAQNRLTCVRTADDRTVRMTYDALGRRRIKAVDGQRTFFAWDGDALLCERFEDQPAREYVYYPGTFEPLALIDGDTKLYYYHNDINGMPQELTRPNGDIVWSADCDALGRVQKLPVEQIAQPLRFQGQYFDEETRLCYNRYRYFDPATCSFISQDPIGLARGENLYAYAPNVWGWVDPLGLACEDASRKGTATVHWHDNRGPDNAFGHYSVEVSTGGKTIHTHQLGAPGTDTMISTDLSGVVLPTKSQTFDIPDAKSAQNFQLKNLNQLGPPYDTKTRSCVTHVGEVLRAGGLDVPTNPGAQFKFLKKAGL